MMATRSSRTRPAVGALRFCTRESVARAPTRNRGRSPRAPRQGCSSAVAAGFSLLEVLVAFVILALVGTALFRLFCGALASLGGRGMEPRALVAEACSPAAASAMPLREGSEQGTEEDGRMRWKTKVEPYHAARTPPELERASETMPTARLPRQRGGRVSGRRPARSATFALATRASAPQGPMRDDAWRAHSRARGFTLVELMIALVLLALHAAVLFGSLDSPARASTAARRRPSDGPRCGSGAGVPAHASRGRSIRSGCARSPSCRCCSRASATSSATPRALPARVAVGGICYFRLAVDPSGNTVRSCWSARFPTSAATQTCPNSAAPSTRCWPTTSPSCASAISAATPTRTTRRADLARPLGRHAAAAAPDPHRRRAVQGAAWPTLVVEPRRAPEAGCRAWDGAAAACGR